MGGISLPAWLVAAGLFFNLFSGNAYRIGLPVSPDRILIGAAIVMVLLERRRVVAAPRAVVLMVLFTMWTVISMATHANPVDSSAVFGLVDRVVLPFVLFVVGGVVFSTSGRRDLLLVALTVIGLYLGVTALLEQTAPGLVWPGYIVDPQLGLGFGRARGPFISPEGMGAALALCGAAAVACAVRLPAWRLAALAVAALDLVGVGLALTRAMWIAAAVGIVLAFVLSPPLRRFAVPTVVGAAVAALAIVGLFPSVLSQLSDRGSDARPVYDRLGSNEAALRILDTMPWTGVGWRRFFPEVGEWVRQADSYPINNVVIEVHNVLLSRAAELGIPAAICLVAIVVLGPLSVWRRRPTGDLVVWRVLSLVAMAMWVVGGFFGPMATPFPTFVAWLVAGVALSSASSRAGFAGVTDRADPTDVTGRPGRTEREAVG